MNKELIKEIEQSQNLGRRQRKIKEKELQKKYNDNSIRIKSGKTFSKSESISREQRRALVKDKNLLKETIKIINKYLPELMKMLSNLTDKRHQSYITYSMKTIIMTRLLALICGITTMNSMSKKFNTEEAIKNISSICNQQLDEIPDWQTIQDVIEDLSIEEIEDIRKYIVVTLIRSKMFDRYRHNGYIQLLVDATGLTSLDYNLNGNCLVRTIDGKKKYFKYVLEAKLVFGNIVISLDSEWIENNELNNEKQKQDCETKAFKRMAKRIKKNYPKLVFIITGDALYATTPIINICKEYNWKYIFNLKKDRLKQIYEDFEDNINYENETSKENYYLSKNIQFKGNSFSAFRYIETKNNKTTIFNYISNLNVTNNNVDKIVAMGRSRWKIENEGFNMQKNGTFCISHLCSRNENALKIHYYFIQIAHVIRQLLEYGSIVLREMRLTIKKEVSSHLLKMLTSISIDLNEVENNFQLRFTD